MTSEQRKAIEAKIGRALTAEEIGRGSITRPEDRDLRARIKQANQQPPPRQNWSKISMDEVEAVMVPQKRETRKSAFEKLKARTEQRAADEKAAAELAAHRANDPGYRRRNQVALAALEAARWDDSIPQSAWERIGRMVEAARNDDPAFEQLNREHVAYLTGIQEDRRTAIDQQIAQLEALKKSAAESTYREPLPPPSKDTYSHVRHPDGTESFIDRTVGEKFTFDPRVPQAREQAEQRLAQYQVDIAGKYGEPISLAQ